MKSSTNRLLLSIFVDLHIGHDATFGLQSVHNRCPYWHWRTLKFCNVTRGTSLQAVHRGVSVCSVLSLSVSCFRIFCGDADVEGVGSF